MLWAAFIQQRSAFEQLVAVRRRSAKPGAPGSFRNENCAACQIKRDVLTGLDFLVKPVPPCLEFIQPAAHSVFINTRLARGKASGPQVVSQFMHWGFSPFLIFDAAMSHHSAKHVMAISENIRGDRDHVARDASKRETRSIDFRIYVGNDHPRRSGLWRSDPYVARQGNDRRKNLVSCSPRESSIFAALRTTAGNTLSHLFDALEGSVQKVRKLTIEFYLSGAPVTKAPVWSGIR